METAERAWPRPPAEFFRVQGAGSLVRRPSGLLAAARTCPLAPAAPEPRRPDDPSCGRGRAWSHVAQTARAMARRTCPAAHLVAPGAISTAAWASVPAKPLVQQAGAAPNWPAAAEPLSGARAEVPLEEQAAAPWAAEGGPLSVAQAGPPWGALAVLLLEGPAAAAPSGADPWEGASPAPCVARASSSLPRSAALRLLKAALAPIQTFPRAQSRRALPKKRRMPIERGRRRLFPGWKPFSLPK